MPAPHRRNKGDSLAHQIKSKAGSKAIRNDGDNLVATRVRKDSKWAEADARLSPAMQRAAEGVKAPDLAQRADRARLDYARGKQYGHYSKQVKAGKAKPPVIVLTRGEPEARYFLGHCVGPRCSREIWVHSPKPRLPFCSPGCAEKYRSK